MAEQPTAYEAVTRQKVESLERRHEELQERINGNLDRIFKILDHIRNRPSWWNVAIITAMAGVIGAMGTFILTHLAH